jgi:hypothetical protein
VKKSERSNTTAMASRRAKTSLNLDGEVYIRALTYKATLRRQPAPAGRRNLLGDIVSEALDQYLQRKGF